MAVDTSVIGKKTGAWRVVLDRSVLANFAAAVGDRGAVYHDVDAARAAGFDGVPAPPTFSFAAPYWGAFAREQQPQDPTADGGNPMHALMGELFAKGALVLHGEQEFEYHRVPVAGDVLDGEQVITDIYEKDTDTANMTFVVMETAWKDASTGAPVLTERFNLIARLKKSMNAVDGWVAAEFEPVLDAFQANFDDRGEVGAAVCVYVDGRPVVDLWGGVADTATQRPWAEDTVVLVFSSTKGVTATVVNLLIERGQLDPDAPVATYWPEFAQNGKGRITLRQLASHQAGLPLIEGEWTLDTALAWTPVVEQLARQAPVWEPGTAHGYHMRTFGWLLGEVVRRVDGRTLGGFVRDELAQPLGLDFWVGLPSEIEPRVATLVPPENPRALKDLLPDSMLLKHVMGSPGDLFAYDEMWNTRALHAAELPSSNGVGDARSLARLYASTIGDVDGVRTLQPETVARATQEQVRGPDQVIVVETAFGIGYMLGSSFGVNNPPTAFGHAGAGGSLAFADPARNVAFGYVMNHLRFDAKGDPRSDTLVAALYASLDH